MAPVRRVPVLVIDFDVKALIETKKLIEQRVCEVLAAASLEQIHHALANASPSVVVIEPAMPGLDPFELCRTIREAHVGELPLILRSSQRLWGDPPRSCQTSWPGGTEEPTGADAVVTWLLSFWASTSGERRSESRSLRGAPLARRVWVECC